MSKAPKVYLIIEVFYDHYRFEQVKLVASSKRRANSLAKDWMIKYWARFDPSRIVHSLRESTEMGKSEEAHLFIRDEKVL